MLRKDDVCPVCAVANYVKKKHEWDTQDDRAAEYLGLEDSFREKIVEAADWYVPSWYDEQEQSEYMKHEPKFRRRLYKVCGLSK
jgi:hypothetical protein